jgi:hypothetical protein
LGRAMVPRAFEPISGRTLMRKSVT